MPVLIVGGGPVGLTCALGLAEAGIPVTLFEAEPALAEDLRASTFHPPTLDMLDRFGLGRALVAQGLVTPRWQIRLQETGERAEFDLGVLHADTHYPFRLQSEQQNLQRLLLDRLQQHPMAEIHFGTRVSSIGQDSESVWVEADGERFAGSWLIGADGAHSIVRRACGIGFAGETYPETTLLVTTDFDFSDAMEGLAGVNYIWSPTGNFSLLQLPGVWRCNYALKLDEDADDALSPGAIEVQLQKVAPRAAPYRILDKRAYRIHQRVADTYRCGRSMLSGDAAHLNSPSGGMGMNGGIHDAFNLVEKLVAVWRGANTDLLDLYVRQRRPIAIEHVIAQADRNRRRMRETDGDRRRAMLSDLQRIAADPMSARDYLLNSSMIAGLRQSAAIA